MKRWAFGLLLVAVLSSAAVVQDGVRTARLPDGHSGAKSKAAAALDQTAAGQKFAFVFFWKDQNPQTGRAWSVLQAAGEYVGHGGRDTHSGVRSVREGGGGTIRNEPCDAAGLGCCALRGGDQGVHERL